MSKSCDAEYNGVFYLLCATESKSCDEVYNGVFYLLCASVSKSCDDEYRDYFTYCVLQCVQVGVE